MRVAVVGHVEWIEFARVERVPAPGEIVHASEAWEEPAGGGAVAAVQLARLAGECLFLTALGDDALGHRAKRELEALGVRVEAAWRGEPQRRAFVYLDADAERTITVMGERARPPRERSAALGRAGRRRRRLLHGGGPRCREGGASRTHIGGDGTRARRTGGRPRPARHVGLERRRRGRALHAGRHRPAAAARRAHGRAPGAARSWRPTARSGGWAAPPLPGPPVDAYGAGDSFAGGLTYGLAEGHSAEEAVALGARCGAACVTGRGPYEGQLREAS